MRVIYNKLVRDRIPEIIEADGHRAVTRVLQDEDYRAALLAALPLTHHELEALAAAKRDKRGGFDSKILLEYTEQAPRI